MTGHETRVGVIGGSGFIGTWLVDALRARGDPVRIIDIEPSERFPELSVGADVSDRAALLEACRGCDLLYNLAAELAQAKAKAQASRVKVAPAANSSSRVTSWSCSMYAIRPSAV